MFEKSNAELYNLQDNWAVLDLDLIPIDVDITEKLELLILNNPEKNIVINGDVTEDFQTKIRAFVQEHREFTLDINLPNYSKYFPIQIELDHLISNHRLEKNRKKIEDNLLVTQKSTSKKAVARILPKRKIIPRIEITTYEEINIETQSISKPDSKNISTIKFTSALPKLDRSPIAAQIVTDILSHPEQTGNLSTWQKLTNRHEDQQFRKNLGSLFNQENHPLLAVLSGKKELNNLFNKWKIELKFEEEQYNALLDVYGQYGAAGLAQLFEIWGKYYDDPYKKLAFLNTYMSLLKHMPSFLPFIEDTKFQDTISNIANLGSEHYSWWAALIENHGNKEGYSCLSSLFEQFTKTRQLIAEKNLTFNKIETINDVKDLSSTLNGFLDLLTKCHLQDQAAQWMCIHNITIPNPNDFHFIIPEMKVGTALKEENDLEWIKKILIDSSETKATAQENEVKKGLMNNPKLIQSAFYHYIATQEQHLSINEYRKIIDGLCSNKNLDNKSKISMLYILAKSTSTKNKTGFDSKAVLEEWQSFESRMIKMDSLDRIAANRTYAVKKIFLLAVSDLSAARMQVLQPIMEMPNTPPMSYLNKLLKLSEYKFLDKNLSVPQLVDVQTNMMKKMIEAASLYADYPEAMMHAIHLIKTETVKQNKDGKYFPDHRDVLLMENFIASCKIFTNHGINKVMPSKLNPSQVLLPLMTTFHLEYESEQLLINKVINPYKARLTHSNAQQQEKIQNLLPYGLSLLRLIQNRKQPPTNELTYNTLNTIQDGLIDLICHSESMTKKGIREWMDRKYGIYFNGTTLIDMKDEVNFDLLFTELNCTQKETCLFISEIVRNFDNEEEKDQHHTLIRSLVTLTEMLTSAQQVRFFEFCQKTFKMHGLLSRNQNQHPNHRAYLTQFKTLIDSMIKNDSFDEFEQYMDIAQEHLSSGGDTTHTLAKCTYLLDVLYPLLRKQEIPRKEAFNFSAELVAITPLSALDSYHEEAQLPIVINYPSELRSLKASICDFIFHESEDINHSDNTTALDRLKRVEQNIEAILIRSTDEEQFKDCKVIKAHVTKMIKTVEERLTHQNNQNRFWKALNRFKNIFYNNLDVTQQEISRLEEQGLTVKLTAKESKTYKDFEKIKIKENQSFSNIVLHLHTKKTSLTGRYSNITKRINDFINMALKTLPKNVGKNHNDLCHLIDQLIALDNQNLVLSLMYHYSGGLPNRKVENLIKLFDLTQYQDLPKKIQKDFIHAIITQMNNSVKCSEEEIHTFLSFIHQHKENASITQCLAKYYQHAPFPSLPTFTAWANNKDINDKQIDEQYQKFDKNPCAFGTHDGREQENGFKLEFAKKLIEKMPKIPRALTDKYLGLIEERQKDARSFSTEKILGELKNFSNNPPANHIRMVMLLVELLHRCKGRIPEFVGTDQVPGRSYELNTTQIIAILSLLETGDKVTAEIGTGEGKSRIMMILNACQFLKGKTVDFLTSNLALAERDYLESLPFFESLGAEVNFITSSSKIEDYKMGGINVSDPENLCLFRNKAFRQNKSDLVLNKNQKKRALLLDEADVTYFDVANLVYASALPQTNIDLSPFFPLLMDFFAQSETEQIYKKNKQRCNEQLLSFIAARNPNLFQLLKSIHTSQLEKWQDAAYIARHLEYNIDYTLVSNATISTPLGNKKTAAAMYRIGSRISKNANFSDGVHQCLHAELNRLMKTQDIDIADLHLKQMLEQCKSKNRVFPINPMNKLLFSNSSNTLLKTYNHGSLHAVTGTIGSEIEQNEIQSEFNTKFISIPRHKGIRRFDRPTRITRNGEAQLDALVEHILVSRANNQPILLVCKDDNESKILHDKLEERLRTQRDEKGLPQLTRIHAGIEYDETISEADYIKNKAGQPGQVTITTEMEGRGVDIELKGKAHAAGLKVLLTYLPHGERDYRQIIGRSGRYGAIGETQMVLSLDTLKADFSINQLNTDFYLNSEDFIMKLQIFAAHTKNLRRLFHRTYDNYLSYFSQRYTALQSEKDDLTPAWSEFLEQYNHSKDLTLQAIETQLEQKKPNINFIKNQLRQHSVKTQEFWSIFIEQLPQDKKESEQNLPAPELNTPILLSRWLKELQKIPGDSVFVDDIQKVCIQDRYDYSAAGRVQIVKNPSLITGFLADLFAFWRGEGILFPNFRAWLAGKLSFTNFLSQLPFFRWIITPKEETHIIRKEISASHAILLQKLAAEDEHHDDVILEPPLFLSHSLFKSIIKRGSDYDIEKPNGFEKGELNRFPDVLTQHR